MFKAFLQGVLSSLVQTVFMCFALFLVVALLWMWILSNQ